MTIKELYEWAKENNAEDLEIVVYDCDGGIFLNETHSIDEPEIYKYNSGYKEVRL